MFRSTESNLLEWSCDISKTGIGLELAEPLELGTLVLIEVATDKHLWAETFDRELTAENIFDIQSEIARQIVYRFDLYDMSIPAFREKRKKILDLLNGYEPE